MKAAIFFLGLAICLSLLFVAFWMILARRRGPNGPYERSNDELKWMNACRALDALSPVKCVVAFADGLWEAKLTTRGGRTWTYTSHHRGRYQNLWDYDKSWFTTRAGERTTLTYDSDPGADDLRKAEPSIEGWLNDRRDEYIHSVEKPAAQRRQIVNRPLDTLN